MSKASRLLVAAAYIAAAIGFWCSLEGRGWQWQLPMLAWVLVLLATFISSRRAGLVALPSVGLLMGLPVMYLGLSLLQKYAWV